MATKKKTKKQTKAKGNPGKNKKITSIKASSKKRLVKKKASPKKAAVKVKAGAARKSIVQLTSARKKPIRGKSQDVNGVVFSPAGVGAESAGQSGSLQGLSNRAGADSESVDELIEEGNAFEAEVVQGVENARDADQGEVRTHEVPEDDVPGEYDDQ